MALIPRPGRGRPLGDLPADQHLRVLAVDLTPGAAARVDALLQRTVATHLEEDSYRLTIEQYRGAVVALVLAGDITIEQGDDLIEVIARIIRDRLGP